MQSSLTFDVEDVDFAFDDPPRKRSRRTGLPDDPAHRSRMMGAFTASTGA
jgi:hypothetical protein